METIRNYLETMFARLPNTVEVQKAKQELWQIMEDKYTELIDEGRTPNEAVGVVISEFGNLDELAKELGIQNFVIQEDKKTNGVRSVTLAEVKDYLHDKTRAAYTVALGVFLCIVSCCGYILNPNGNWRNKWVFAMSFMFVSIAVAVGLFMFSSFAMKKWKFLKNQACSIDFATADYVHNQREGFHVTYAMMITIGVILCILSVLPVVVLGNLFGWSSGFGVVLMFMFIGIAVFLFVVAGNVNAGFSTVLSLNKRDTIGGCFVPSQKQVTYKSERIAQIMSVYWPTVTCIYLCWSFLSFDWHITWTVWVVAALIQQLIRNL